jgi:DNA-binding IclR family transcriptional regulator
MAEAVPGKLVGALTSGLSVTRYLCASGGRAGVSRIARDLELNPSTCFNLLKTLVHEGIVSFDPATKTYGIGLGLIELAKGAIEQATYARLVHPHLQAIATAHGVTATLWQRSSGERVVLVDRADNGAAVRVHMNIGQRLPMYIAALGRCMAAHSGLDRAQMRQRFDALRWEAGPSFDQYWKSVQDARARGYATDTGHYVKGVTTASAAVLDGSGEPVMAISAVGFAASLSRSSLKQLGEDLRDRACEVSRALSGLPAVSSVGRSVPVR